MIKKIKKKKQKIKQMHYIYIYNTLIKLHGKLVYFISLKYTEAREVQTSKPQFTPNIHTSLPNNQMCANQEHIYGRAL